jgi:hypothetical protein
MVIWNLVEIRPKSFLISNNPESFLIRFQKNPTILKTVEIKWYSIRKWLEFVLTIFILTVSCNYFPFFMSNAKFFQFGTQISCGFNFSFLMRSSLKFVGVKVALQVIERTKLLHKYET